MPSIPLANVNGLQPLQWGRDVAVADAWLAEGLNGMDGSFNGAATLPSRMHQDTNDAHDANQLQWGRDVAVADALCSAFQSAVISVLQWGRDVAVADAAIAEHTNQKVFFLARFEHPCVAVRPTYVRLSKMPAVSRPTDVERLCVRHASPPRSKPQTMRLFRSAGMACEPNTCIGGIHDSRSTTVPRSSTMTRS